MFGAKAWRGHSYDLGRMGLRDLAVAYATCPAIQVYTLLAAASTALALVWAEGLLPLAVSAALAALVYPVVWYAVHRYVLHGRWLYKSPLTARLWKRVHFDHHQDPHRLEVLFGALPNTLPTIALASVPVGLAIAGLAGAAAAFAAGLLTTCVYEFCHCVQHLNYKPRWRHFLRLKQLHLAHHFHNEEGNYGITSFACDRLFGSYYAAVKDVPRSPTVFNLGYDDSESLRYPWVATLSGGPPSARPPRYEDAVQASSLAAGGAG